MRAGRLMGLGLAAFLLFSTASQGQVIQEWVALYGGLANDGGSKVLIASDGNIVVGGSFGNYAGFLKYDPAGQLLFSASFPLPAEGSITGMAEDSEGNLCMVGADTDSGICIRKATHDGYLLWTQSYVGAANYYAWAVGIILDRANDVYVAGTSIEDPYYPTEDWDVIVMKCDGETGEFVWIQYFDGAAGGRDECFGIAYDGLDRVCITGRTATNFSYPYNYDILTIMYEMDGDTVWMRTYNGPGNVNDQGQCLVFDSSGNIYVAGFIRATNGNADFITLKYSPSGDLLWIQSYDSPDSLWEAAEAIALDAQNNVIVTGICEVDGYPVQNFDILTIKYNDSGNLLWIETSAGPNPSEVDNPSSLAVDVFGDIYILGTYGGLGSYGDFATLKYTSTGDLMWRQIYDNPSSGWDYAYDLALDALLNVYVVGRSQIGYSNYDCCLIKYHQTDIPNIPPQITAFWPEQLDTVQLQQTVEFWASASDPEGDSLLWQWRLDGTEAGTDSFCAITFDQLGNHQVSVYASDGELSDSVVWEIVVIGLAVEEKTKTIPVDFLLYHPCPNPFNPSTVASFELRVPSHVGLQVYDTAGRLVKILVDGRRPAGKHQAIFDGSGLPSGIYLARLTAGDFQQTQKLVLLK